MKNVLRVTSWKWGNQGEGISFKVKESFALLELGIDGLSKENRHFDKIQRENRA